MTSGKIEFGVQVPPEGRDFEQMKRLCLVAEDAGYSVFTVTDHFQNMVKPDGSTNHPLEAWTLLGGLASVTSKIKLGTLVSCVHYRHPTILAKMATTVDIISGGRTIFGVGAGWHQKEFEGFLGEFPSAKKRLDGLEEVYSAKNTLNSPLPIQQPIPIMVGGGGIKRTLKLAAKYADISHFGFYFEGDDVITQRIDALKEHCKAAGRDYNEITKSISLSVNFNPTQADFEESARRVSIRRKIPLDEARKIIEKTRMHPEAILDTVNSYIDKSVTLFLMVLNNEENIRLFAENVMKKI